MSRPIRRCTNCKAPCYGKLCRLCFEAGKREYKKRTYHGFISTEISEEERITLTKYGDKGGLIK